MDEVLKLERPKRDDDEAEGVVEPSEDTPKPSDLDPGR